MRSGRSGPASVRLLTAPDYQPGKDQESGATALLVRPTNRRVMAVLARIVPAHAVVGKGAALDAHSKCELIRDRMTNRRPDLAAAMHGRQRLHRHMHDAGDFRRAALASDGVF